MKYLRSIYPEIGVVTKKSFSFNQTSMTMSLINSYGLMKRMQLIRARQASMDELLSFHSKDYLEYCHKASEAKDREKFQRDNRNYFIYTSWLTLLK